MNDTKKALTRRPPTSFAPKTFSEAVAFATQIAGTNFVPSSYKGKPDEILAAIQYGAELGMAPMTCLNSLVVIQGKVTMYASTMRALVEASGLMEMCRVSYQEKPPLATVVVRRVGREDETYTFSRKDAEDAGLANREMYKKYPRRMYVSRAMSFALRDEFADVLKGLMGAEEMDEAGTVIQHSEEFVDAPVEVDSKDEDAYQVYLESCQEAAQAGKFKDLCHAYREGTSIHQSRLTDEGEWERLKVTSKGQSNA